MPPSAVQHGLCSFNPVLVAIAIGGMFFVLSRKVRLTLILFFGPSPRTPCAVVGIAGVFYRAAGVGRGRR